MDGLKKDLDVLLVSPDPMITVREMRETLEVEEEMEKEPLHMSDVPPVYEITVEEDEEEMDGRDEDGDDYDAALLAFAPAYEQHGDVSMATTTKVVNLIDFGDLDTASVCSS